MTIKERLSVVKEKVKRAAEKSGRREEDIIILAACKGVDSERVAEAIREGVRVLGENYVQEAIRRKGELGELSLLVEWHFIGHLQMNKVKKALELFDVVETVDSIRLAQELDKRAGGSGKALPVLVEVNIGEEPTKFGVKAEELMPFLEQLSILGNLKVLGLMTMGPPLEKEKMRPYFVKMRELFERARENFSGGGNIQMSLLSMGMSSDYDVAIEEGANLIRLGTAIFGEKR